MTHASTGTATATGMAARIAALALAPPERFPEALQPWAVDALLDTLAVTVAGRADPQAVALAAALAPSGSGLGAADAATVLGFASHVMDYDDVSMLCVCHPSAPVLSALLAFVTSGEARAPVSGAAFLNAYCAGTEALVRTGQALGFVHYQLGFHPTATLGTLGAAAAVSALAGLDAAQCATALGIAASMSGGLKKNFGSSVKPLHVGLAAASGLRAVRMAQAGLSASADAFEGQGFLHAFSGGQVDRWPEGLALGEPFVVMAPGFEAKRYPCCYLLHKLIEAVLLLRREQGARTSGWTRAAVRLPAGSSQALMHPYPATGLAAKFSAPHAVVAGLLDGRIDLASFEDAAVLRAEVQQRLRDVEVTEVGAETSRGGDIGEAPVELELWWPDGSSSQARISALPGSPQDPMTPEQRRAKWLDCLRVGRPDLPAGQAEVRFDEGQRFAAMADVRPWLRELLAPRG